MMKPQLSSLQDIVTNRLCTGCGACAALAPGFVTMQETMDENRRPRTIQPMSDEQEDRLVASCPSVNTPQTDQSSMLSQAWGPVLEVWEGYAADEEIRFKGSSGGVVSALSLAAMESAGFSGVLHVKASQKEPTQNEASLSANRQQLLEGAGSRYAPASVADRLDLVAEAGGACVVVGKPCDIKGVQAVAAQDRLVAQNLGLAISIFCAGTPNQKGTEVLLEHLGVPKDANLADLRYRGHGWPGQMKAAWLTSDGRSEESATSYSDGWGNVLQKHRQWRCLTCADHTGEVADLSVGDPWQRPLSEHEAGRSLIIVRTERGRAMLKRAITAGHIVAELRQPDILFDAQPNLFATKGAVWGRRLMQRLSGRATLPLRPDSFHCWRQLPFKAKVQSLAGTLKRIVRRKLYRKKTVAWLDEAA